MRSGDLASEVVLNESHSLAERAAGLSHLLRRDFTADLEFGATLAKRVFLGRFLFSAVPARMVDFIRAARDSVVDPGSVRRHAAISWV
jgi:hypothetical protein